MGLLAGVEYAVVFVVEWIPVWRGALGVYSLWNPRRSPLFRLQASLVTGATKLSCDRGRCNEIRKVRMEREAQPSKAVEIVGFAFEADSNATETVFSKGFSIAPRTCGVMPSLLRRSARGRQRVEGWEIIPETCGQSKSGVVFAGHCRKKRLHNVPYLQ